MTVTEVGQVDVRSIKDEVEGGLKVRIGVGTRRPKCSTAASILIEIAVTTSTPAPHEEQVSG